MKPLPLVLTRTLSLIFLLLPGACAVSRPQQGWTVSDMARDWKVVFPPHN